MDLVRLVLGGLGMIGWLRRHADAFRGRGDSAPTVPPMDGALRPNTLLETARVLLRIDAPDSLVATRDGVLFSSSAGVFRLDPQSGTVASVRRFEHAVTCVASSDEVLAVGLEDGSIRLCRAGHDLPALVTLGGQRLVCPTALAFRDPTTLIVCQGSARNSPNHWKHDLMQRESSGSVWQVSITDGTSRRLAGGLAFPYGAALGNGDVVICESWRHRLLRLSDGSATPVLSDLPGYPARLVAAGDGGFWLSVFAPRSQLIEFVLGETAYRERMMRELAPEHWVAPSLSPALSFLEPMQGGALRSHGILKPWSPTRSYGLLVRLDARLQPIASFHSRADGRHHGVTSCVEIGSQILVSSKGGNAILALPAAAGDTP